MLNIVTATRTGCPTKAHPGTVGCLDGFGIRVACGDEWISVGKVKVLGKLTDATELLRPDDLMDEAGESDHPDRKQIRDAEFDLF